jgi:hypothetical protein
MIGNCRLLRDLRDNIDGFLSEAMSRIHASKLLQALPGIDLGCVEISAAVDRDVVDNVELARHAAGAANARKYLRRLAIHDSQFVVHSIRHKNVSLRGIRR